MDFKSKLQTYFQVHAKLVDALTKKFGDVSYFGPLFYDENKTLYINYESYTGQSGFITHEEFIPQANIDKNDWNTFICCFYFFDRILDDYLYNEKDMPPLRIEDYKAQRVVYGTKPNVELSLDIYDLSEAMELSQSPSELACVLDEISKDEGLLLEA